MVLEQEEDTCQVSLSCIIKLQPPWRKSILEYFFNRCVVWIQNVSPLVACASQIFVSVTKHVTNNLREERLGLAQTFRVASLWSAGPITVGLQQAQHQLWKCVLMETILPNHVRHPWPQKAAPYPTLDLMKPLLLS